MTEMHVSLLQLSEKVIRCEIVGQPTDFLSMQVVFSVAAFWRLLRSNP